MKGKVPEEGIQTKEYFGEFTISTDELAIQELIIGCALIQHFSENFAWESIDFDFETVLVRVLALDVMVNNYNFVIHFI